MSNSATESHQMGAWVLDLVALDLWLGNKLIYTVTSLTEHDARKRSVVQRTMEDLHLGRYDIERDAWVLHRKKVIAYLEKEYAEGTAKTSARQDLARALLERAKHEVSA